MPAELILSLVDSRSNQSVERVAESLDLSEDVVRPRLSRGRKLLEVRVAAFVEGTLRKSAPGPAFTLAVMGAFPVQMAATGAASAGVAAAKTGAAASHCLACITQLTGGSLRCISCDVTELQNGHGGCEYRTRA